MGYFIFYPYRGMSDQICKNQYALERMIVWLINPLEFNFILDVYTTQSLHRKNDT